MAGDSVARRERDTLVIDTTDFTDKTSFRGSSDKLHVLERLRRVDADTILYSFMVEKSDDMGPAVEWRVHLGGGQAR
jgi:hypothetical protein